MKKVLLDGVECRYIEAGEGVPFVFVHGGLEDLRAWESHVGYFSRIGRAIAYSRCYNHPNATPPFRQDHSAKTEADDLVQFITALNLGPINVVGSSYGAYTALFLVLRRPDLVRAAVLSEAPLIGWLPSIEGGQSVFDAFHHNWWKAAARAFQSGDEERALQTTIDWWGAQGAVFNAEALSWSRLPDEFRQLMRDNVNDLRAMVMSSDAFPGPSRDEVERIDRPILLLSGERTISVHRLIDAELERTLRRCSRVVIRDARHEMWAEQPDECRRHAARASSDASRGVSQWAIRRHNNSCRSRPALGGETWDSRSLRDCWGLRFC